MQKYLLTLIALLLLVVLCSWEAGAAIYERDRYVKLADPQQGFIRNAAFVYDENFDRFDPDPIFRDRSIEYFSDDDVFWILGVEVDVVVRNSDGAIEVRSNEDAYARMVHHCNFVYGGGRGRGGSQPLYGTGSELTHFNLPKPYAYKIEGGYMSVANWHFHNEAGLPPGEEVYLRFKLTCDDEDIGYIDTNAFWFDIRSLAQSEFCIPPGRFVFPNPTRYTFADPQKIVAAVAHIHDHVRSVQLMVNDVVLWDYSVPREDSWGFHFSHSSDCSRHSWHRNANHVKQKTVTGWTPKGGVVVGKGDRMWITSEYYNDHDTSIDGMVIVAVFFERS